MKKLGHIHTMTMILIVMGIRLIAYSYLVNPWYTLPIDLLNGLTLGVYWSTVRSIIYFLLFRLFSYLVLLFTVRWHRMQISPHHPKQQSHFKEFLVRFLKE